MESKISWFMKNPAIYLGAVLLFIFGSQFYLGYAQGRKFYVLEFVFSIIGLIMILMSIITKISNKKSKST
ncbi:hypothetical protein ACLHDF_24110 [Priestia aryabhattai]|uniref:hypothetical protein n=1 Tax=Priestia megaterium TaxID=1404 RepID=UPI0039B89BFE